MGSASGEGDPKTFDNTKTLNAITPISMVTTTAIPYTNQTLPDDFTKPILAAEPAQPRQENAEPRPGRPNSPSPAKGVRVAKPPPAPSEATAHKQRRRPMSALSADTDRLSPVG